MKRTFSLAVALAIVLTLSPFLARSAKACNYTFSNYVSYAAPIAQVRAFTFQPVYTAQTFAYATYAPFALQVVPPVVQEVKAVETVRVETPVNLYSAPTVTYTPCPATAVFLAPSYSSVQFAPVKSQSFTRVRAPFTSVTVDNGRFFRRGSFTAVRAPFADVVVENDVAFRGRRRGRTDTFTSVRSAGADVNVVNRQGGLRGLLFGDVQRTTVDTPGVRSSVTTRARTRRRR